MSVTDNVMEGQHENGPKLMFMLLLLLVARGTIVESLYYLFSAHLYTLSSLACFLHMRGAHAFTTHLPEVWSRNRSETETTREKFRISEPVRIFRELSVNQ